MSEYIWANPDRLKYNAGGYGELANELGVVIDDQDSLMNGLEGPAVWGDDDAGQAFASAYLPSRLALHQGVKTVRDGIQYTADGVLLMADTFEQGEDGNTQRAYALRNQILNGGGGQNGGGGGDGEQPGERKRFYRSERPTEGEHLQSRLHLKKASTSTVKVVKAVALVDQNGNPWPPNSQDRPRRVLGLDEMTALGMPKPTGAFLPVETTLTEEEIQQLARSGAKPLAPVDGEPPVKFIGAAQKEGDQPTRPLLARQRVRGKLLAPLAPHLPEEPLLPVVPEGVGVLADGYEPPEGEVEVPGHPLFLRARHLADDEGQFNLLPARFEPVRPAIPAVPPIEQQ